MKYLLIEFIEDDNTKWEKVLNYILPKATHVEFSQLYKDDNLVKFKKKFEDLIEPKDKNINKIYVGGKIIRLRVNEELSNYIKSRSFAEYKNSSLEDPSFFIDEKEVIATITHEGQIYIDPNEINISEFDDFEFAHKISTEREKSIWQRVCDFF